MATQHVDSSATSTTRYSGAIPDTDTVPTVEVTILMPCLDEAQTVATCIREAFSFLEANAVLGEVLIADNGSTDGSREIARAAGARVIEVPERGYGAALGAGIAAASGRFVIMGDADETYDFSALMPFVEKLRGGWQLVMGDRFAGGIAPGAMPPLHKYLGNPVLSGIANMLFRSPVHDFHCGLRGFESAAVRGLRLRTSGMEFASEMVVRASLAGLRITEVPTTLSVSGRTRPPHLRSWRDGWRHLRFLLIYSPTWLFLYPGIALVLLGVVSMAALAFGDITIGRVTFGVHTLLYGSLALIVGFETIELARFLQFLGVRSGELPKGGLLSRVEPLMTLERTLVAGAVLVLLGIVGSLDAVRVWSMTGFGPLSPESVMRITIPSATAIIIGVQSVLSAFFMFALKYGPGYNE